ncbi:MAG: L-idonate 5-dehydrogenase, partial [Rhodospirillales bacterium]|nr:L-idonate 5-dehydrogenase [Rhodospirillales bacterium]
MSQTMQAAVLHAARDLRRQPWQAPQPGPGEVRVQVGRVGICGSDVHYFQHGRCGVFVPTRPFVLGHELCGVVESLGEGVQGGADAPAVGTRVVVHPARMCGRCEACLAGRANLCENLVFLGSGSTDPPTDGAFADYLVVAARQCLPVPDAMSDGEAAMMEPLAVALHAARRARLEPGVSVVITGGGPIGLLTALSARACGAGQVAISEPDAARRKAAGAFADELLDPVADDFVARAAEVSHGGFDVALEASGAPSALRDTLRLVRRGGTIVQIGTLSDDEPALPANHIMTRELNVLGSFRYIDEFRAAMEMVTSGRIDIKPLISEVLPFEQLDAAIKLACEGRDVMKVQMEIGD